MKNLTEVPKENIVYILKKNGTFPYQHNGWQQNLVFGNMMVSSYWPTFCTVLFSVYQPVGHGPSVRHNVVFMWATQHGEKCLQLLCFENLKKGSVKMTNIIVLTIFFLDIHKQNRFLLVLYTQSNIHCFAIIMFLQYL